MSNHVKPPFPWFGIDIGGTLVKLVYFAPNDFEKEFESSAKAKFLMIQRYLSKDEAYGESGCRDENLQINDIFLGNVSGTLHFIKFLTSEMNGFLKIAKQIDVKSVSPTLLATGGGAYKFEQDFKSKLDLDLRKFDELESLIRGINLVVKHKPSECYYFVDPMDEKKCQKVVFNFSEPYPYLVVNIGSGVSILSVYSQIDIRRVSGSSLGGGTFLGLCCLLTGCTTFEEAIKLAKKGNYTKVDKSVKDIYGGDYSKFNLRGDVIASSFGKMIDKENRKEVTKEDLACSTLITITNNIGSIAHMCAKNEGIERILFVGNFLHVNPISMKILTSSMNYWSDGTKKALFLEHEGYLGAIGCLSELIN